MLLLLVVLESGLGRDRLDKVRLARRWSTKELLSDLVPWGSVLAEALFIVLEETHVDKNLDELREASISESTSG